MAALFLKLHYGPWNNGTPASVYIPAKSWGSVYLHQSLGDQWLICHPIPKQLIIQTSSLSLISNLSPCHTTRPCFRTSTSTLSTLLSPLSQCSPSLFSSHPLKTPQAVTLQRHNGNNWLELSKPEAILPFLTQHTSASCPAALTPMHTAFAYLLTQGCQCC